MSISSVSSTSPSTVIQATTARAGSVTDSDDVQATGVNVDISKPGQLMAELADLAKTDPEKFKTVTAQIAQQLKTAAGSASGGSAAMLGKIADRFSAAAQSGNASDLAPPDSGRAQKHHGGHHHHAEGGVTSATGGTGGAQPNPVSETVQSIISAALQG